MDLYDVDKPFDPNQMQWVAFNDDHDSSYMETESNASNNESTIKLDDIPF